MFESAADNPTRRQVLWFTLPVLGAAGAFLWRNVAAPVRLPASATGEQVSIYEFSSAGAKLALKSVPKIVRTDAEWWTRLTPQQYYVTRVHSTDTPFTGTYFQMHDAGLFRCICCDNALFSSDAKYDSGTGWPSFWEPVANDNVRTVDVAGVTREDGLEVGIEVLCKLCDAHLGHIFGDGPPPSKLRYCINESALKFVPRAS